MNKEETLALYAQGKETWNAWANDLLARREDSEAWKDAAEADFRSYAFQEAHFSEFIFPGNALFDGATFKGPAVFGGVTFKGTAKFEKARFTGIAIFSGATFESAAEFFEATFEAIALVGALRTETEETVSVKNFVPDGAARFIGDAHFWKVTFKGLAEFEKVIFKRTARFASSIFESEAMFEKATFEKDAKFGASIFEGGVSFNDTSFRAEAEFHAVRGNSIFTIAKVEFHEVPNFEQATFVQAPRLDNVKIEAQLSRWDKIKTFFTKGDLEKEGRWRALRRLAEQGKDYLSERRFFKEEVIARRGVTDKWGSTPFWFGVFYQLVSNFGLSLSRPLIAWFMVFLGFAWAYAYGSGGPWWPAFLLSLHKSLPALSSFSSGLPGLYARLYGVASCDSLRPIIPDSVIVLGIMQTLFSAVMIFLFLLAVRNHFRIK